MEPEKSLTCPRCGNRMQLGSIIDYGQNRFVSRQARWVEGEPEKSWITGSMKTSGRRVIPITSYRCQSCGYLESYAS